MRNPSTESVAKGRAAIVIGQDGSQHLRVGQPLYHQLAHRDHFARFLISCLACLHFVSFVFVGHLGLNAGVMCSQMLETSQHELLVRLHVPVSNDEHFPKN